MRKQLSCTEIYRGGITSSYLSLETRKCSYVYNDRLDRAELRFHIASKGGGTTSVLVRLGYDDLRDMVFGLAEISPSQGLSLLLDGVVYVHSKMSDGEQISGKPHGLQLRYSEGQLFVA